MEPSIEDTLALIREAHAGQRDWTGEEYWTHPVAVMHLLGPDAPEAERKAALLHDIVEDTPETIESLRGRGYSEEVLAMVALVTREKPHERGDSQTYMEFIEAIVSSGNRGAMRVKLAVTGITPIRLGSRPCRTRRNAGTWSRWRSPATSVPAGSWRRD